MTGTAHQELPTMVDQPIPATRRRRRGGLIVAAVTAVALAAGGAWVLMGNGTTPETSTASTSVADGGAAQALTASAELTSQLTYLAEEEKLALDLYVLGESLYSSQVFSNISRSETTHQTSVRQLLVTYGVPDPSAGQAPGVFVDPAIQTLYTALAARVATSEAEAAQVGILVEQTDIADLRDALASSPPEDVATVLTRLEAASQNHLRAFTRYVDRV